MLIELKIKNFRSFRDEQVFSMVAGPDEGLDANLVINPAFKSRRLLKSAIIYGANASGKSNLLKALAFLSSFIKKDPTKLTKISVELRPFLLDANSAQESTRFEISFIYTGIRYQYTLEVDSNQILTESLFAYPKGQPQKWFVRSALHEGGFEYSFGSHFRGERTQLTERTRQDVSFITIGAAFNHPQLSGIYDWFANYLRVIRADELRVSQGDDTSLLLRKHEFLKEAVISLLQDSDIGISGLKLSMRNPTEDIMTQLEVLQQGPEELHGAFNTLNNYFKKRLERQELPEIQLMHSARHAPEGVPFSISDESSGTRRLLSLSGVWIESMIKGCVLAVDELDASLHPQLVRMLVRIFRDTSLNNAQLIFNTHDTTLLDGSLLRRDQIWFVEKDTEGASHLYPLLEFSPRKDEALQKGYLQGRYGAIPFLGQSVDSVVKEVLNDRPKAS